MDRNLKSSVGKIDVPGSKCLAPVRHFDGGGGSTGGGERKVALSP